MLINIHEKPNRLRGTFIAREINIDFKCDNYVPISVNILFVFVLFTQILNGSNFNYISK